MARRRKGRSVNGILLVDKHQGESSNAIVQQVKRLYGAAKAGHTGALDPLATGMLPVCLGEATKFSQFLLDADKTYEVEAQLGVRTDTSDADGSVVQTRDVDVSLSALNHALEQFRGPIKQVPSMYSALKHDGHPLYYYARQGITIEREPRQIEVFSNELLSFENDSLRLRIHCSKGTYIRTIIDDLGELLGCGAHVRELRRTQVADFPATMQSVEQYRALIDETAPAEAQQRILDALLLPMDTPVLSLAALSLDAKGMKALQLGQAIPREQSTVRLSGQSGSEAFNSLHVGQGLRVYGPDDVFLGMVEYTEQDTFQPKRLVVYEHV
ncbi:tRNA pseudouridine(55) synthase TruB [Glaciecola siphonariae]|uniref:tRNA pseudouridine synthase B n=1 Tax=Glaciecola siphonariae TaxID=521012 RepID=A0ABV9LTU2_9ALTE